MLVSGAEDADEELDTLPPDYDEDYPLKYTAAVSKTSGDDSKDKLIKVETTEKGNVSIIISCHFCYTCLDLKPNTTNSLVNDFALTHV